MGRRPMGPRVDALGLACPVCDAAPGRPCEQILLDLGPELTQPHEARRMAVRERNQALGYAR